MKCMTTLHYFFQSLVIYKFWLSKYVYLRTGKISVFFLIFGFYSLNMNYVTSTLADNAYRIYSAMTGFPSLE